MGYPDGLSGHEIPLPARILQLADIYDALTSVRPYKPALDPVTALEIMQQEARRGWRDPELMRLFVSLHADIIQHAAVCVADTGPALGAMQHSLHNLERHLACEPMPRFARVVAGD